MSETVIKLTGRDGKPVEMKANMSLYKAAADNKRSVRLEARYQAAQQGVNWDPEKGDLLDQMFAASGLFDHVEGGNALTIADLAAQELSAGFRAPDGSDNSAGARLLYPQMILETLNQSALNDDGSDLINQWNSMIALTRNVNGQRAEQPIINTKNAEESASQRITQLAEPATMVSITTGEKSYKIPTNSIGLLISDEARQVTTIDLVTLVLQAQARGERIRRIKEQLKAMVLGDTDLGISALPIIKAGTLDSSITTDGTITKKAYIKWLNRTQSKADITKVLSNIDDILSLDDSLTSTQRPDAGKIPTFFNGLNLGIPVPEFVSFDADLFGAGILVGLDPRYAIQRFVNVSASYEAIENYVMRKATAFRVDYGELASRLYDDAWSVLSYEKA